MGAVTNITPVLQTGAAKLFPVIYIFLTGIKN